MVELFHALLCVLQLREHRVLEQLALAVERLDLDCDLGDPLLVLLGHRRLELLYQVRFLLLLLVLDLVALHEVREEDREVVLHLLEVE